LEWFAIQPLFLNAKADVLFLLDCCSAASAATSSHIATGTKETIAACAFEAAAPEPGAHSFTSELIEVLDKWKYRAPFSVAMLHSELLINLRHHKPKKDMFGKIVESRRTPVYFVTTSSFKTVSIEFTRRFAKSGDNQLEGRPQKRRRMSPKAALTETGSVSSDDSPATSDNSAEDPLSTSSESGDYTQDQLNRVLPDGDLAIPHVLISLALEGEQLLEVGAWNKWLSECPSFAKYARIEGMYKSHSTILVLSVPVVIWNLVPDHLACSFIGYIDSINYIREETWQDNNELQSWLRRKNGWDNERPNSSSEAPDQSANSSLVPEDLKHENTISSFRARSMSSMAATWGTDSMQLNTSHHENTITFSPLPLVSSFHSGLEFERAGPSASGETFDTASNADHGSVRSIGSIYSVGSIISWRGLSPPPDPEPLYAEEQDPRPFGKLQRSVSQKLPEERGDQGEDDEDQQERDPKKIKENEPVNKSDIDLLLACPFWKQSPDKYNNQYHPDSNSRRGKYRTCEGPGFTDIPRLKYVRICFKRGHSLLTKIEST
jgi:hypothetical protein